MSEPRASHFVSADPEPPTEWRLLPWELVAAALERAARYWLMTVRPDGSPHTVPVWGIWGDDALLVEMGRASRKARNLAANPALAVHLDTADPVVILEGIVREVVESELLAEFAAAYERKHAAAYEPGRPVRIVYRVEPRVAYAWIESSQPQTGTRYAW